MTDGSTENITRTPEQGHYSILGFMHMPAGAKVFFNELEKIEPSALAKAELESISSSLTGQHCSLINRATFALDSDINWGDEKPWPKAPAATITLLIFTQDASNNNEKLMLIPGSHYPDSTYGELLNGAFQKTPNAFGIENDKIPAHTIAVKKFDILAVNPDIQLATINLKNSTPMLAFSFAPSPQGSF